MVLMGLLVVIVVSRLVIVVPVSHYGGLRTSRRGHQLFHGSYGLACGHRGVPTCHRGACFSLWWSSDFSPWASAFPWFLWACLWSSWCPDLSSWCLFLTMVVFGLLAVGISFSMVLMGLLVVIVVSRLVIVV